LEKKWFKVLDDWRTFKEEQEKKEQER